MIRKYLIVGVTLLTFLCNVVPAYAYRTLVTPVAITAGGLVGSIATFTPSVVAVPGDTPVTAIGFASPSGITNSDEAIKWTSACNEANNRVIIYTDNNNNTVAPNKVPLVNASTGIDGSGLVGQTDANYTVAMFWATSNTPNTIGNYTFGDPAAPVNGGSGNAVYMVDKRHNRSFTPVNSTIDNQALYNSAGSSVTNAAGDGLYPQLWDVDLYNSSNTTTRAIVSPALYSSIATVAYGITQNSTLGYYTCNTPNLVTYNPSNQSTLGDTITANLVKFNSNNTDRNVYVYVGADFQGKPAQNYTTAKLYIELAAD